MITGDKGKEVYGLGSDAPRQEPKRPRKGWWIAGLVVLLAAITAGIWLGLREKGAPDYYFEPESASLPVPGDTLAVAKQPYMELMDETVNDVPLSVYIPH